MSHVDEERRAESMRLRPYFEVQLLLAERLAAQGPVSFAEACLKFTNLHRRFGLGRAIDGAPASEWTHYLAGLEGCDAMRERLEWTVEFFRGTQREPEPDPLFGCFAYEPPNAEGVVRIHFHNRDAGDGTSPLARHKVDRRIGDLRAMFGHVRAHHPDAARVLGGSWLYNLEAYRRLFPPAYVASRFEPERVRLDGTSSWGQFLDFRGFVKLNVRDAFLRNLATLDGAAPWRSFPLRALGVSSGIEQFYEHYAC
jgi:hypothetical protein